MTIGLLERAAARRAPLHAEAHPPKRAKRLKLPAEKLSQVLFDVSTQCARYLSNQMIAHLAGVNRHFYLSVTKCVYLAPPYGDTLCSWRLAGLYHRIIGAKTVGALRHKLIDLCATPLICRAPFVVPDIYRNNLKNRFLTASALPQNFDSSGCFGIETNRGRALDFMHTMEKMVYGRLIALRKNPQKAFAEVPDNQEAALLQMAQKQTLEDAFNVSDELIAWVVSTCDDPRLLEGDIQHLYDLTDLTLVAAGGLPLPRDLFLSRLKVYIVNKQIREFFKDILYLLHWWEQISNERFGLVAKEALVRLNDALEGHDTSQVLSDLEELVLDLLTHTPHGPRTVCECQASLALNRYQMHLFTAVVRRAHSNSVHMLRDISQATEHADSVKECLLKTVQSPDADYPIMHTLRQSLLNDAGRVLALQELDDDHPLVRALSLRPDECSVLKEGPLSFAGTALLLVYANLFKPKACDPC